MILQETTYSKRVQSIDFLRGIAMIVMALDHVRDYFHVDANMHNPLDLASSSPLLFFTRWITHFCAPAFILLSGLSINLQGLRKSKKELSFFLFTRGLWFIFAEFVIVSFAWTFNPHYNIIPMQVIWAFGISMICMSVLIYLPLPIILVISLSIIFGHNFLDQFEQTTSFQAGFWWDLFHHGVFKPYQIFGNHHAMMVYPFPVWTAVMALGYCLGQYYHTGYDQKKRLKVVFGMASFSLLLFVLLRYTNLYGDPMPWSGQKNTLYTFLSFVNVNKYPPSLLFICLTIGVTLFCLWLLEKFKLDKIQFVHVFGRVAFFYYLLHLYLIHIFAVFCFFIRGHLMADVTNIGSQFPFWFVIPGEGFNLIQVYIIWLMVVALLYLPCKLYDSYKLANKQNKWLSYL